MTGPSSQLPMLLRYVLAGAGGLVLVLGVVAVFGTLNGLGSLALVVSGAVLVLGALGLLPGLRRPFEQSVEGSAPVLDLLGSPDPAIRMAAAEAVLGRVHGPRRSPGGDPRQVAVSVLLERDLVRRLGDLLRHSGYAVEPDGARPGMTTVGADLVVGVTGSEGVSAVPVSLSTSSGGDVQREVQRIGAVAARMGARTAIALFTGQHDGDVPLGHVTAVGEVRVATVFSPQLSDERAILAALKESAALSRPAEAAISDSPVTEVRSSAP